MRKRIGLTWCLAVWLLGVGCTEAEETGLLEETVVAVPMGKADDYRSTMGREYALVAIDEVTLSGSDLALEGAALEARLEELVGLRNKAVSFFLYAYLSAKLESDKNATYGDFQTNIRQFTFDNLVIGEEEDRPGTYSYLFAAEAAGPNDLMGRLPLDGKSFELTMPRLSNGELATGSYTRTYSSFDPSRFDAADLTTLEMEISAKPAEADAYPDYVALFADGVVDVAIHVGGDYNAQRYDLLTAEEIFVRLQRDLRLKAPVATFAELRADSGPFTGQLNANGRSVRFEVFLYHPGMHADVGYEGLLELFKQSAASKDIVIYDGHAGYDASYSGVVTSYNPRVGLPAEAFAELEVAEKYQVFFFNGCKTYTTYADALYRNPRKTVANLDVLTSVNFAWMSDMSRVSVDFLRSLFSQQAGQHYPRTYDYVLSFLNAGVSWNVIYGVHGLSDNPHASPYAEAASLCTHCRDNSGCPGVDSMCIAGAQGNTCAYACTADDGCPEGYACMPVSVVGTTTILGHQCLPRGGVCR